jgi:hypothetical protein
VADGHTTSLLSRFGDFAKDLASSSAGSSPEFNGYRYRILSKPKLPEESTTLLLMER